MAYPKNKYRNFNAQNKGPFEWSHKSHIIMYNQEGRLLSQKQVPLFGGKAVILAPIINLVRYF